LHKPGKNEILVKMEYSPINPSDLLYMTGFYPQDDKFPKTLGFEGSGIVQQLGEDLIIPHKIGDRVAVFAATGVWTTYAVVDSTWAFHIPDDISLEQASMHFINPWTVEILVEEVKQRNVKACVHTAGAGAFGKLLIKRLKLEGIKLINLVRREGLVKELEPFKPDFVVNTEKPGWEQELKKLYEENEATLCFDAICGDLTSKVLSAMPPSSHLSIYGNLAGPTITNIAVNNLIFQEKTIRIVARKLGEETKRQS